MLKLPSRIRALFVVIAVSATASFALASCGTASIPRATITSEPTVPLVGPPVPIHSLPAEATLPISQNPTGPMGMAQNTLGSPAVAVSSCTPDSSSPSTFAMAVANSGFSLACYHAPANTGLEGVLTDDATNANTGLTIAAEVTISTIAQPVVAQADRPSTPMPGLTVPSDPVPVLNLSNAIFTSPTASTNSPISFDIPPLSPGLYLLQLPTLPMTPSAILEVGGLPASAQVPVPAASQSPGDPANVAGVPSSDASNSALVSAFNSWEQLPSSCQAVMVPNSSRFATVITSGVQWAMAKFAPSSSCSYSLAPATPGGAPRPVPPDLIGPFAEPGGQPVGVFEESPGGNWIMNEEGGSPFPCPAPEGALPGIGNGAIPGDVLASWGMTYATNCAFVSYPLQPR